MFKMCVHLLTKVQKNLQHGNKLIKTHENFIDKATKRKRMDVNRGIHVMIHDEIFLWNFSFGTKF
jgi:hypothetical protein